MLTPVEIEDRLDNLDRRLDRIEQILPTLVTKDDLAQALERAEGNTTERFEQAERNMAEQFERAERNTAKRFEQAERNTAERFEQAGRTLAEAFELAQRDARTLHEDLVGKIKLLGEHRPKRR